MSYDVKNFLLKGVSQVIGASVTTQAVSKPIPMSAADSKNLLVKVVAADVTSAAEISAILQDSYDGGTSWETVKSVEVTADGAFELEVDSSEDSAGSTWSLCRVVITTGAGDAATISAVHVSRRR